MITRKFRSVAWAATVATAALGCYLVSYRVSAERSMLEDVERDIRDARHDILTLNTELQTRSRMAQLEMWNRNTLALSAPGPGQFIEDDTEFAALMGRDAPDAVAEAEVQNASADAGEERLIDEDVFEVPDTGTDAVPHLQQASYDPAEHARLRAEELAARDDAESAE